MKCQEVVASKTMKYLFKEKTMKKFSIAILTNLLLVSSVFACQTTTIIVNGKLTTCTVCGNVVNCF
jgi:hypothetical protein